MTSLEVLYHSDCSVNTKRAPHYIGEHSSEVQIYIYIYIAGNGSDGTREGRLSGEIFITLYFVLCLNQALVKKLVF